MKPSYKKIMNRRGALSFEWILVTVLLVIGIVGGLATVRDAAILNFWRVSEAVGNLDQSFGDPDYPADDPIHNPYGHHKSEKTIITVETP